MKYKEKAQSTKLQQAYKLRGKASHIRKLNNNHSLIWIINNSLLKRRKEFPSFVVNPENQEGFKYCILGKLIVFYCVMTNSVEDQENDASYYAKPQTNYHCCLQFSFCFHALDWLFPCNTITFMFTVIFLCSHKRCTSFSQSMCTSMYLTYCWISQIKSINSKHSKKDWQQKCSFIRMTIAVQRI